jgi:hypothetical protein
MNRSWRKQIDFQNANTAVMSRRRKSPGQISKVVNNSNQNSYTEKKICYHNYTKDSNQCFNSLLIRAEIFVDHLCKINSTLWLIYRLPEARSIGTWKFRLSVETAFWKVMWFEILSWFLPRGCGKNCNPHNLFCAEMWTRDHPIPKQACKLLGCDIRKSVC